MHRHRAKQPQRAKEKKLTIYSLGRTILWSLIFKKNED